MSIYESREMPDVCWLRLNLYAIRSIRIFRRPFDFICVQFVCKPKLYVQLQTNFTDKRGQKNQKKQVWSMGCHKNLIVINVYVWHLI